MNLIVLDGRLGKDPVRYDGEEGRVGASFTLAVDNYIGSGESATDWFQIRCYGPQAKSALRFLKKGSRVIVEGSMRNFSRKNEDGTFTQINFVIARQVSFVDGISDQEANRDF